jgi:hypothetical protein
MYTSILLVALVGIEPPLPEREAPTWLRDYDQARKEGQRASKPLAVLIGAGEEGYDQVSQEGKLSREASRLLAEHYVCVYLNTDTPQGRRLAGAFNIKQKAGMVLSDRTGDYQAFHYPGALRDDELTGCLKRFADPNLVVRTTATSPYERVSYYPPQTTTAPAPASSVLTYPAAPNYYYPPVNYGYPAFGGGFGGGFGRGGC